VEINGIAHVQLSVRRFEQCRAFYERLMPFLGLEQVHSSERMAYWVGGRTGFSISRVSPEYAEDPHEPLRSGLHHLCFRARTREDVDAVYPLVRELGAEIVRAPEEGPWAPGYYSLSFLDPDGIRLEVNHVPGKGVFAEGAGFDAAGDY
jgi:catechol 2,3-dioxygenase-like lactoylglutathione lyase family enzyme